MNKPDIKNILQIILNVLAKLSVLKNNKSLLISIILAFVSILIFVATHFISVSLTRQMQAESISRADKIQNLKLVLESAPSLEVAEKRLQALSEDANEIAHLAIQTTQRELLNDEIFMLDPSDTNNFSPLVIQEFASNYRKGIEKLITESNAGDSPSTTEVEKYIQGGNSVEQTELDAMMFDNICAKRAESFSFYARAEDLSGYKYWDNYATDVDTVEAVEDCWLSQLGYWVIEDIFSTIKAVNAGYDNTLVSPVKRLMGVVFTDGANRQNAYWRLTLPASQKYSMRTRNSTDLPCYIRATNEGLTESFTGNISNSNIDIIHFNATFVISTKALFPLIQELSSAKEHKFKDESGREHTYKHNQITVLEIRMNAIDPKDSVHYIHRYGEDSVCEIEVIGEYHFIKQGYESFKPESIKALLAEVIN